MQRLSASALDLKAFIRPGDQILWGQGTGEPQTLSEALVAQCADLGGVGVFVGSTFSRTLQPEHAEHIRVSSFGAIGTTSALSRAKVLEILPCHVGQIARYLRAGYLACDVAFVQVSAAGPDGRHSFGLIHDYVRAAVDRARVVVAEINDQVPWTHAVDALAPEEIDFAIETSRPLLEVAPARVGELERTIAAHAARYIGDGSVLQMGIGAIPDAILQSIGDRRDLGLHSGMVGDALVDLVECGALTNARKSIDAGVSVAGALIGSRRLYAFAHDNRALLMRDSDYTHGERVLAQVRQLVSINSAVEVDLTGQVNAEQAGGSYVGGTGGQVDYVRAGHRSEGGHSIIAFPSTAKNDEISRIVLQLSGPVTTARSDVDVIVTEYGAAELRGQPLRERVRRMIGIAHPKFREALERDAHEFFRRGY